MRLLSGAYVPLRPRIVSVVRLPAEHSLSPAQQKTRWTDRQKNREGGSERKRERDSERERKTERERN